MRAFAQRLMMQGQMSAPKVPTAIFGTAGSEGQALYAGQPALRIGLWPLRSAEKPELAMGLFTLLGFLLERWQGVRVYRLAARLEEESSQWQWSMANSQFGVDDWQLDGLDDNVGIWGELECDSAGLRLALFVEDDRLAEDTPPVEISYNARTLSALVNALPGVARQIAFTLNVDVFRRNSPLYAGGDWKEGALQEALELAFRQELRLYLHLWGQTRSDNQTIEDLQQLAQRVQPLGEIGAWISAKCQARWLHFSDDGEMLQPAVALQDELFPEFAAAAIIVAETIFARGRPGRAIELLEAREEGADSTLVLALADFYRRSGRVSEAVDALQDGIEAGQRSCDLLTYYGDLLQAMDLGGMSCESLVFVDPDQEPQDTQLWEALAAWEAAHQLEPENPQLLQRMLVSLAELDSEDARFWPAFEALVTLEDGNEALRQVIDACYGLDSLAPALSLLQDAFARQPNNLELGLNLAEVLLLEQDEAALETLLAKLRPLARDEEAQAEIARLQLMAEEPEFEMRLGEIEGVLDAGNALGSQDTEWLEDIIVRAPGLGGMHALLARAYQGWNESAAALETLLDGFRRFPADAELAALLGAHLWLAGEEELAFEFLGKGLAQNPNDVPLLALTGQYLFEDEQEAAARSCLARAEALAPRHPALAQARARIAALMAGA